MILQDLIECHRLRLVHGDGSVEISDLTDDSRTVRPGGVFIVRRGTHGDGHDFIGQAIQRGAVAVICDRQRLAGQIPCGQNARTVAWVSGAKIDHDMVGRLAEHFYGRPSEKLALIGVTGTNGKTTTAFLIQHLLQSAGCRCGMVGTITVDNGAQRTKASLTTPGAVCLSKHLSAMVDNGCQAAVLEVSSHALDQGRTAALHFNGGVFTNLTGDHLDYHHSIDHYAQAKARLFAQLPVQGWAVVNGDDPYAQQVVGCCPAKVTWCSLDSQRRRRTRKADDCFADVLALEPDRSRARLDGPWGRIETWIPLVGRHNVANLLQALAAAYKLVDLGPRLGQVVEACPSVPGRLERVGRPLEPNGGPVVLVDYAHTHDALDNVLRGLRTVTKGKLLVVFGCGGDRDRSKRPRMAAVACRLADQVVVTTDNPRREDPQQIVDDVLEGVPPKARPRVTVEIDRARAIATTIWQAGQGDTVLLAGKGHEDCQIIGTHKHAFDDRLHAQLALRQWGQHVVV